jgi:hypothetical protein
MMKNLLKTVFVLLLSANVTAADLTESFNTFTSGGYGNYTHNGWAIVDGLAETGGAYQYVSKGIRLDDDPGAAVISPSKLGGVGDISFWYRNWSSPAIDFYVYTSPDSTNWTVVDSVKGLTNTTYLNFTTTVNDASAKFIKVVSSGQKMLLLDEFSITDASGGCTGYYIDSIATEICAFDSVEFRGSFYKTDGIYKDTVTSTCDTIFILNLSTTIYTVYDLADTICSMDDSLLFNGVYVKTVGIYYDTTVRAGMCDSVTKLTLATKYCATPCGDLFISEYIEGSSFNKAIEIYNPTASPINLSQYKLVVFAASTDSITLTGSLASGDVYVVTHSSASLLGITSNTDLALGLNFNGDDKIELVKSGSVIDRFGDLNPAGNFAKDQTFQRKKAIEIGTLVYSATDWNILPKDTDSLIGSHESNCICITTSDTITTSVCMGDSATNGVNFYKTTGIYSDTLINVGGCDSILVLNLTVEYLRDTTTTSICQGSSVMFDGQTLTMTGVYSDTLLTSGGCDSISMLDLTVSDYIRDTVIKIICSNDSVANGSNFYKIAGVYSDTVQTLQGCDSISVLDLTVNAYLRDTTITTICQGSSVMFDGQMLTVTGVYSDTLLTSGGCDSISMLDLTVSDYIRDTTSTTICNGSSIVFGGQTYTTAGYYSDTLSTSAGCDSISVLDLSVTSYLRDTTVTTICMGGSIVFDGQTLTMAGFYSDTLSTSGGCDSISVLNLTIGDYLRDTLDATICFGDSYMFDGQTLTTAGFYSDTLVTSGGCDSISVLNLSVTIVGNTVSVSGLTITANETNATYVWVDCDNNYTALSPAETGQSFTTTTTGNYAVILTNGTCVDTSACITLTTTGINDVNNEIEASIYPNPTTDIVNVKVTQLGAYSLTVMDVAGKVVMSKTITDELSQLDFNGYDSGVYFITLYNENQKSTFKLKVK